MGADAVILRPLFDAGRGAPVEALRATLVPRFTANQVVVQLAIGRELFGPDGTTLLDLATPDGGTDVRRQIGAAVEEAMRALKAGGEL